MLTLRTLSDMLPFALAGAISPAIVALVTLYLQSPQHGRRRAIFCLLGIVTLTILFGLIAHFVLRGIGEVHVRKDRQYLVGLGNLVIAGALFVWAVVRMIRGPVPVPDEAPVVNRSRTTVTAFASGFGLMALNVTTLPLYALMIRSATRSGLAVGSQLLVLAVVTVIILSPAWFPIALTYVMPKRAQRVLGALNGFLAKYGRTLFTIALFALGIYLIILGAPDVWDKAMR